MIKRAILSVSDKSGIVELARFLGERGVEILSTGGTFRHLADSGVRAVQISEWSGAPEVFGGRVKTLTPRVFGAILFDRDDEEHLRQAAENAIPEIDLVVVNLYPFEATVARSGVTLPEAIEQIDVGGPSMLRAAAKNHRHVLPLCDPSLYAEFMNRWDNGDVPEEFRRRAAIEVFRKTSAYDLAIASFLRSAGHLQSGEGFEDEKTLHLRRGQVLRYGENPQQSAAFYVDGSRRDMPFTQHQGKELSYNNLIDLDAGWRLAGSFTAPAAVIIKHTNPCGVGTAKSVASALRLGLEADPVSAFGGIIAVNREFDAECASIVSSMFLEVIIAPSFSTAALEALGKKKNLRLLSSAGMATQWEMRTAAGGFLLQSSDGFNDPATWKVVTRASPTPEQMEALAFCWTVCAMVKSNAIVLGRANQSIGIGAGQMSRVDSARIAIMKSILPTSGSVAASDAFFPFRDGLDVLADAGVAAVIQPGGSVRDDEVIAAADERQLAMVFTGERHFRH